MKSRLRFHCATGVVVNASPISLGSNLSLKILNEVMTIFSPQREISTSSIIKLKKIILNVLRYIRRKSIGGVIALPKEVFVRARAHACSMRTIFNYKTIRSAFEKLGVIESLNIKTYKGGPCQHYSVSLGSDVKRKKEKEFVGRKKVKSSVSQYDKYAIDILGDEVPVSGSAVIGFAKEYEKKLREYLHNPYLRILKDGHLFKGSKLSFYIRGAAICSKYRYNIGRFIEAQFFYFHQWRGEAADIRYTTSVYSMWNSIGRYEAYCERFGDELNYFGGGKDNLERTVQDVKRKELPAFSVKMAVTMAVQDYERIADAFDLSDRDLFFRYGHPLRPMLSLHFLMDHPVWLALLSEKAWGEAVDFEFWKFLNKVDIKKIR